MKVVITERAFCTFDQLLDFLLKTHTPDVVEAIGEKLLEQAYLLEAHPYLGQIEEWLIDEPEIFRRLVVDKKYKIIYQIQGKEILVHNFFGVRQSTSKMKS